MNDIEWGCTDIDSQQYGRQISEDEFEFKEFDRINYNLIDELESLGRENFNTLYFNLKDYWIIKTVDLREYSLSEQKEYCSAYYSEEEFKDLTNWIIAECIFEQESGLY